MDKFEACYQINKEILDKYVELLYSPIYAINPIAHNYIVNEIKKLVLEDYILLHSMTLDEINYYLSYEYTEEDGYDLDVIPKVINKLITTRDILLGKVITSNELGLESALKNIEFGVYDTILSMINIDVIKTLKCKIYSLKADCKSDERFINLLQQRLKISKIELLFCSSVSEIITLHYNTSIDDTPRIDINMIKNKIQKHNSTEMKNSIINVLSVYTDKNINEVIKIEGLNNNSDDVFHFLVIITMIEVLISYMDRSSLEKYYNYCCEMTNDKNKASIGIVKKLIKQKIND